MKKSFFIINKNIYLIFLILECFAFAKNLNFKKENYFIKKEYISRDKYHHHDDRPFTDGSQNEVYLLAHNLVTQNNLKYIADIGCGSAYKLIKYFNNYTTTGYEIEPTLGFLKAKYPNKNWELSLLNSLPKNPNTDLIICADVVEHLVDPDELLNFINRFNFRYLVISTPDRDKLIYIQKDPQSQSGPPVNPAHIREWSFAEFSQYISKYFTIVSHTHSEQEYWGQVIVAEKKNE